MILATAVSFESLCLKPKKSGPGNVVPDYLCQTIKYTVDMKGTNDIGG